MTTESVGILRPPDSTADAVRLPGSDRGSSRSMSTPRGDERRVGYDSGGPNRTVIATGPAVVDHLIDHTFDDPTAVPRAATGRTMFATSGTSTIRSGRSTDTHRRSASGSMMSAPR